MPDRLSTSLQESLLTLIVTNDQEGAIASGIVSAELFEPPYDEIITKALGYRRKFGKAPGLQHLDDVFDYVLANPKDKRQRLFQQIMDGILSQAKGLNAKYVLSRANEFVKQQELKAGVLEAAQRYQQGQEGLVEDVQNILHKALKFRVEPLDAGTFLNDKKRALSFLTNPKAESYGLGIPELDKKGIGPGTGRALAFLAPKGRGKTWFCIHCGTRMMRQSARVVHISLEMSEEEITERYFQSLFAIAQKDEKFRRTSFEFDELNRIAGFKTRKATPKLAYTDPHILRKLSRHIDAWGGHFGNLVVKQFAPSALSIEGLLAYLDGLELNHGFIPNGLILDYPKLMKLDRRQELRIALGLMMEQLRGVCVERNVAGVFPVQANRTGERISLVTSAEMGEDYSQAQTADIVLTYSQTKAEHDLNVARLYVDKARRAQDGFVVLISQSYATGQFVRDSTYISSEGYWKLFERDKGD